MCKIYHNVKKSTQIDDVETTEILSHSGGHHPIARPTVDQIENDKSSQKGMKKE